METESEMKKKYPVLHKRIGMLESQLNPILESIITETPPPNDVNVITDQIDSQFDFINKLVIAEYTNLTQDSDQADAHHLAQIIRKVQLLQSACQTWKNAMPTSSGVESSEPPVSYFDSYEDYDNEEGSELCNYDDQEEKKEPCLVGFKTHDNPAFVGQDDDDDQDGEVNYEGVGDYSEYSEDQVEDELVRDDSETEEERISGISDDLIQVAEVEGIKEDDTVTVCDLKERKIEDLDTSGDDDVDDNSATRKCYRGFWVVLIGTGIISVIAGFSDFLDNHSSAVFLTPT